MKINFCGSVSEFITETSVKNETSFPDARFENGYLIIGIGGNRNDGYNEITLRVNQPSDKITDEFIQENFDEDEDLEENINYILKEWCEENYLNLRDDVGVIEVGGIITQSSYEEDEKTFTIENEEEDVICSVEHQWQRYYGLLLKFELPSEWDWDEVFDWNEMDCEVLETTETSPAGMGVENYHFLSRKAKANLLQRMKKLMVREECCLV